VVFLSSPQSQNFKPAVLREHAFWPVVLQAEQGPRVLWHREENGTIWIYEEEIGGSPSPIGQGVVLAAALKSPRPSAALVILRNGRVSLLMENEGSWSQPIDIAPAGDRPACALSFDQAAGYLIALAVGDFLMLYKIEDQTPSAPHAISVLRPAPSSFQFVKLGDTYLIAAEGTGVRAYPVGAEGFGKSSMLFELPEPVTDLQVQADREGYLHIVARTESTLWYSTTCPPPEADFTLAPTIGDPPLRVLFTNLSRGIINAVLWDFGDGAQSNLQDPDHVYRDAGAYSVTLTVRGPGGAASKKLERAVLVQSAGATLRIPTIPITPDATRVWHPIMARFPVPLRGFQLALVFPPDAFLENPQITFENTPVQLLEPEFVAARSEPAGKQRALFLGVIFDYSPPFDGRVLEPQDRTDKEVPLVYLTYRPRTDIKGFHPLRFVNTLGDPPIRNIFTSIETKTLVPLLENGGLTVGPSGEIPFLRGDPNNDGQLDVADAIYLLSYLFAQGPPPEPCLDAGDANDSGEIDVADPIALLSFLFSGGLPPPYPFPIPGLDPTADDLHCNGS